MPENYRKEIVQRIITNMLDIQLLRMLQHQPLWGYRIKKNVETDFHIKLRHGALYPTLKNLEQKEFLTSQKEQKDGRSRKVYSITEKGLEYLSSYYSIINEHTELAWWYPLAHL